MEMQRRVIWPEGVEMIAQLEAHIEAIKADHEADAAKIVRGRAQDELDRHDFIRLDDLKASYFRATEPAIKELCKLDQLTFSPVWILTAEEAEHLTLPAA